MTEEQKTIDHINQMSQYEMGYAWRFYPAGHQFFRSDLPFFKIFNKRFEELGGMTPEISKELNEDYMWRNNL